jgi:hypothetical protein
MDNVTLIRVVSGVIAVPVLLLRLYFIPKWYARAAQNRGQSYRSWFIGALIFGPIMTGLIYLVTCLVSKEFRETDLSGKRKAKEAVPIGAF